MRETCLAGRGNGSKNSLVPPFSRLALLILLLAASCSHREERRSALVPSQAIERARRYDLVDVREMIPGIAVDLRYGTSRNVAGRRLYPAHMPCLLRRATAEKLRLAQALLAAQGYGIRIWDAYRPPEVHLILLHHGGHTGMFQTMDDGWSRHCAGISVDATLVDSRGREMRMPTYFDEDFEHAKLAYDGADPVVRQNLAIFQQAMRRAGFTAVTSEWWHFDDPDFSGDGQPVIHASKLGIPIL